MMESTYYMLGIERDKSPDLPPIVRNMSWFVILEDRMFGNTVKFPVYFDVKTGRYREPNEAILEEYYEAIGEPYERPDNSDVDKGFLESGSETDTPPWSY